MSPLLDLATGWLLFLSLAVATGCVATHWVVLSARDAAPPLDDARTSVARMGAWAMSGLLVALILVAVRQFFEFRDPFAPWQEDARLLLTGTAWGRTWVAAAAGTVVAAGSFVHARRGGRVFWVVASVFTLLLDTFPALTGHANAGEHRILTLPADVLHVWAAGGWIGTLAVVLLLEASHRRRSAGRGSPSSLLPELVPRFSPLAVACVATLVATGIAGSWVHLDGIPALWRTHYGRLLALKVLVVLGVLALGAWNWKRLSPRVGEPEGSAALRRAATLELVLANVVLAVTALLVRSSPL